MKAIFVAGGLTGLVLITTLVLGLRGDAPGSQAASIGAAPGEVLGVSAAAQPPVDAAQVQALLDQNEQLRDAVRTMQAREGQYQQQLETANRTIQELERQPVQAAPSYYDDDDGEYEEHEEHEDEHEEDQHEYDED